MLVILKRIDVDSDAIVCGDLFPGSYARANLGRIVFADPAHIQVFPVVGEEGSGGLADGLAIVRSPLLEDGNHRLGFTWCSIQKVSEF